MERLASSLARTLAAYDAPPEDLFATARELLQERRCGAVLAELHFDSAYDRGPIPGLAEGFGSRTLAFRAPAVALILGVESEGETAVVKGLIVKLDDRRGYRASVRCRGGSSVPVADRSHRRFACQFARGCPLRFELVPESAGDSVVLTDWVVL